jgi:hypothetical protein
MSDRPWWSIALQWSLWAVAMTLVMGWLARNRLKKRPPEVAGRLVHPTSTLVIALIGLVLFNGAAVASVLFPDETTNVWISLAFVGLSCLSLPLLHDYLLSVHEVSDEGLRFSKPLGIKKHVRWDDVANVRYAPMMKWFRLESRSGDVARISVMLMGLPEFARVLLENVPEFRIEKNTLPVLQRTAEGNPPSLWE